MTARFEEAVAYAMVVHGTATRKGSGVPYVSHLLQVAGLALHSGGNEDEAIGALLHDAVEDGGGLPRLRDIEGRFGAPVARIVHGCSDSFETPKRPWLERKAQYVGRIPDESASVVLVSAADKLHNVTAILSDYRERGDALWHVFNKDAGQSGTIGYYRGLVAAYTATGHHPRLIRDLDVAVSQLEAATGSQGVWPPPARPRSGDAD